MDLSTDYKAQSAEIADLFTATFAASEGADESVLIGDLARRLMAQTPERNLQVYSAWDGCALLGGIFFSWLTYGGKARTIFVLAP